MTPKVGRVAPCAPPFAVGPAAGSPLAPRSSSPHSAVALIVTVIMLSVITFLAVAFLALMGREKGSVKISTDQTIARLASDTARERAQAELLATILATTNPANFDLLVSTNYINWQGFDPGAANGFTNVNYDYQVVPGNPVLTAAQALQNLTNLFYNPRPPVFISNRLTGFYEFRFYNDQNRNGRYDRSGFWPLTNGLGQLILSNGVPVTNHLVGDPEWLGGLERADLPHSSSNRFAYRYSYLVVPAGKTLDLNYIHNQTQAAVPGTMDAFGGNFFRNEGVGTWEVNLAAFLYDLNTNSVHGWGFGNGSYAYDPITALSTGGIAFSDAAGLYRYRLNGNPNLLTYNPASIATIFRAPGVTAFANDFIDGYSSGPLLTTPFTGLTPDPDRNPAVRTGLPWPGAPQTNHFFTPQDLFNPTKTDTGAGNKFTDRLTWAGTNVSTYDQYTYYRLLAQLGMDSAPEDPDKLNLNYKNTSGLSATNFVPWTATDFFTNVVDRLLKTYTAEWLAADYAYFTNHFQVTKAFRLASDTNYTYIPVFVNGRMVYSPAVHRVLQLAANLWDAKPNERATNGLPTVFRPFFTKINGNVFISGFGEVKKTNDLQVVNRPPLDLSASTNLPSPFLADELIYGVPLVIGARKGLPNFNEYSMDTLFSLTRKIELRKSGPGSQRMINQTNQFFTMSVSVASGAEFWNSYRTNYNQPVRILVNNRLTISLTNDNPGSTPVIQTFVASGVVTTNSWKGWKDYTGDGSFIVPLRTNHNLFVPPTVAYLPGSGKFVAANTAIYEVEPRLLFPRWYLAITNRVQAMIVDASDASGRIIDYVLLGDMTYRTNMAEVIGQLPTSVGFNGLWGTNASGNLLTGRPGIIQQLLVSQGNFSGTPPNDWVNGYGTFPSDRAAQIAKFGAFFLPPGSEASFTDPETLETKRASNSSLVAYTPFNPSVTFAIPMSWQANDPLVHYIARDMFYQEKSGRTDPIKPPGTTNKLAMENIGFKNERYKPWSADPGAVQSDPDVVNPTLKDPLVTASDDWQFPTNTLPTLGWLGRIHRGTPWQSIYLKASDLGARPQNYPTVLGNPGTWATNVYFAPFAAKWSKWTGNTDLLEGFFSRPVTDRVLFDVFTTAFNDNSTRGQLSVNQTGLAAWSAIFSGMVALTNNSPAVNPSSPLPPSFSPYVIQPAGTYDPLNSATWPPLVRIVEGINRTRANTNLFPHGTFEHLGDILAVPELTSTSPFLNLGNPYALQRGLNDAAYEWLPQQVMSLLRLGEPRFVIYAYGQALHPAPSSVYLSSGPYFQMCTNYQITAEVATRAVVRVEGSSDPRNANHPDVKKRYPPHLVVENFNYLAPD